MIAQLPLEYAAADALYAAGLGLLLALLYTCVRMLLPATKLFAFLCDFGIFCLAAVLYESIAIARFYSGIARWYTILALILGYFSWQIAAHSKLIHLAKVLKAVLLWPVLVFNNLLIKPLRVKTGERYNAFRKKRQEKHKAKRKNRTKQLQTPSQVLYNSK